MRFILLLVSLMFVSGCGIITDADKRAHARVQAHTFCACLNSSVRIVQLNEDAWTVYCENGTASSNASYGSEYSCK